MRHLLVSFITVIAFLINVIASATASENDEIRWKQIYNKICNQGGCSADSVNNMDDVQFLMNVLQPMLKIVKLKQKYEEAKAREQSTANRALTAATVAATGIGGMELAQGLAEQKADEAAAADMAAYLTTFQCSYGNDTFVNGGLEQIELPGGNDETLRNLKQEYIALALKLKERKEALGMAPGIESEIEIDADRKEFVLNSANMGLYDNENIGITGGKYSSIYRATVLNSESDQNKIASEHETTQKRVDYGGAAAGIGAVGGVIGNSVINGTNSTTSNNINNMIKNIK